MSARFRIAIGGLASESCTFSPLPTRLADIEVLRGDELLDRHPYIAQVEDVAFEPLLRAYALPGGPWEARAFDLLLSELLAALSADGPWDGVLLDLHGALYVKGHEDAEAHLLASVRRTVGPDCIIAASYDLHGNVSEHVMAQVDILTAYRTAPHVDDDETRERAAHLLLRCLREGRRPARALVRLPLTLPGERAMTTVEPGRSLYARIPALVGGPVWDASLLVGYTWADEPRVGATAVVLADDVLSAEATALELADAWWSQRHVFQFGQETGSVDECIARAMQCAAGPVFISDAGDNVTGGGVGDVPHVLERLLAHGVGRALYASLADAAAVSACQAAGVGSAVALSLGGKLDPIHGRPLAVDAHVVRLADTPMTGPAAVVQIAGVTAILTARRCAFTTPEQFSALGLAPHSFHIVVIKLGYLFDRLRPLAMRSLLAFSPGCINADITQLPFHHLRRPIYPLDPEVDWQPAAIVWEP
jgi:microcystin degradation protein MlrC